MTHSTDWNFNDDAVYIPSEDSRTPEQADQDWEGYRKKEAELLKMEVARWKDNVLKILTFINEGGEFTFSPVRKRIRKGVDYLMFTRISSGGGVLLPEVLTNMDRYAHKGFGEDGDAVSHHLKNILVKAINQEIAIGRIGDISNVAVCNIGKINELYMGQGLGVELM